LQIDTKQRIWYLSATSQSERDKWIKAIQLQISGYTSLQQKQVQSSNSLSEKNSNLPSTVTIASATSNNILNTKVNSSSSSEQQQQQPQQQQQQQINNNNRKSFDEPGSFISFHFISSYFDCFYFQHSVSYMIYCFAVIFEFEEDLDEPVTKFPIDDLGLFI
jgi:preprotein translocase subunit SecF